MPKIKKSALMKATELLANQEQSSKILRKKLLVRKFDPNEVDAAIDKLKKYNYLDDNEFCQRQFENFYAENKLSLRQILIKLVQRGFDKNFIENLIPDDFEERERLVAENLLAKKFSSAKFDKNKAWQFLAARGFDSDIISSTIDSFS